MALPILAVVLAVRGELMIGSDQGNNIRIFMASDDEVEGIGLQRVKESGSSPGCLQTSVSYLLWEGQSAGLNTAFCECYTPETGYVDTTRTCEVK
jgi:hypothetical protein